jgi:hypothetical protein
MFKRKLALSMATLKYEAQAVLLFPATRCPAAYHAHSIHAHDQDPHHRLRRGRQVRRQGISVARSGQGCANGVSRDAHDGRDCTHNFGREWKAGADGVRKRGGILRAASHRYGCGELGVGARDGWLDVDVDEVRGVWCRDGDVKGGFGREDD